MAASHDPPIAFATCGELLKFLRRRARLSLRELSIAVGYSESHLSRIENNMRAVDRTTLLARFVPALDIQDEPEIIAHLLTLCAAQESAPSGDAASSPLQSPSTTERPAHTPQSADVDHHRLPAPLTSFIGRVEEVAEVCELLRTQQARLVTLTGAGGCGKTRLALRVGEELTQHYADGVHLVELAALLEPHLLPKTVAGLWGLHQSGDDDPLTALTESLRNRRLLLILDNCEHLIDAAADLVAKLLRGCPQVQILATSREALAVPGEVHYHVQPLALPLLQRGRPLLAAEVEHFDAIQLFVERARLALPGFTLTDHNATPVTAICQRLDGIPLGIELAAAWVYLLSPTQIADHLAQGFDLLVGGGRTVLPRHQTMHAAIDWSYQLLTEAERTLLRRLTVFAGGWTLAGAEAVVAATVDGEPTLPEKAVLPLLQQVVNKSLVVVNHLSTGDVRYRLLEPVRQYLTTKLTADEAKEMRSHHLRYFCAVAERLEAQSRGAAQATALAIFDREQDNLRTALTWGLTEQGASIDDRRSAARLTADLGRFWYMLQQWREGSDWLQKALEVVIDEEDVRPEQRTPEDCALAAQLLLRASSMTRNLTLAQRRLEQSLALWRRAADRRGAARALQELGSIAVEQGDYTRAAELLTEALNQAYALDDAWLIAISLSKLADLAGERNDFAACERWATQQLTFARRLGDIGMSIAALNLLAQCALAGGRPTEAIALLQEGLTLDRQRNPQSRGGPWSFRNLGLAYQMLGDYTQASTYFRKSLQLRCEQEDWAGMAWALEGLGEVAALTARPLEAAQLWGAAAALRQSVGSVMSMGDQQRNAHLVTAVKQQLDREAFQRAWAIGEAMSPAEIAAA